MVYNQKPSPLGVSTMHHDDPRPISRRYPSDPSPVDTRGVEIRGNLRAAPDRLDDIRARRIALMRDLYMAGVITPDEYASAFCDEVERRQQADLRGFC